MDSSRDIGPSTIKTNILRHLYSSSRNELWVGTNAILIMNFQFIVGEWSIVLPPSVFSYA